MVLYTGATVEEAIQKGLNDLDIPRMKAHITVVAVSYTHLTLPTIA